MNRWSVVEYFVLFATDIISLLLLYIDWVRYYGIHRKFTVGTLSIKPEGMLDESAVSVWLDSAKDFLKSSHLGPGLVSLAGLLSVAVAGAEADKIKDDQNLFILVLAITLGSVSYTHLTLPTILLV